jgi:hypothetical protein
LATAYLTERGKNLATKNDIEGIVDRLEKTTRVAESVRIEVASRAAIDQKRWETKLECYSQVAEALAEICTMPATDDQDYLTAIRPALGRINLSGTVARMAVKPTVRTFLSNIGERLNAAATVEKKRMVALHGWMATIDLAREDLFGEPREMTDQELLPG